MFSKVSLIEQAILIDKVPSILPIDFDKLKNNIIKNYGFQNVQNESDWSYLNQYCNLDDDLNITWLHDYIRDHYRLKTGKTPVVKAYSVRTNLPWRPHFQLLYNSRN